MTGENWRPLNFATGWNVGETVKFSFHFVSVASGPQIEDLFKSARFRRRFVPQKCAGFARPVFPNGVARSRVGLQAAKSLFLMFFHQPREVVRGSTTIFEHERGLLFENGRFLRELGAGTHRIGWWKKRKITVCDLRRAVLTLTGQKSLSLDGITISLNLSASFSVFEPLLAVTRAQSYSAQLYEDAQLAAREVVAASPLDELLANRAAVNEKLTQIVANRAREYGLEVASLAVKDVVLSNRVRDLLMKEAEIKRLAQAQLLGAREEVAALRALANAAKMARENPELLRLRELEIARSLASNAGNTLIFGVNTTNSIGNASGERG